MSLSLKAERAIANNKSNATILLTIVIAISMHQTTANHGNSGTGVIICTITHWITTAVMSMVTIITMSTPASMTDINPKIRTIRKPSQPNGRAFLMVKMLIMKLPYLDCSRDIIHLGRKQNHSQLNDTDLSRCCGNRNRIDSHL